MQANAGFFRVLTQRDFDRFARLTGDDNPIHCDPEFAKHSHFGATVAHGMFLYSLVSKALGEINPGPGTVQIKQTLMFPEPTFVGEPIEIVVRQLDAEGDDGIVFETTVEKTANGKRVVTLQGEARVVSCGSPRSYADTKAIGPAANSADTDPELYGLRPGMTAQGSRTFDNNDLDAYADLVGDRNPLFTDDEWARQRGFARRIVPGPLLAGMLSDLLGTQLPGRGTGWMKQSLVFCSPVYSGEAISAEVKIVRLRKEKELVNLACTLTAQDGRVVAAGESLVLVRNLESTNRT